MASRSQWSGFFTLAQFSFTNSLNKYHVSRSVFNFWNVLGEIGGLYGVLYGSFAAILSIINFNKTENFMVAQIYASGPASSNKTSLDQSQTEQDGWRKRSLDKPQEQAYRHLDPDSLNSIAQYLRSKLPACCCRSRNKSNQLDSLFERARSRMESELDIVTFVRKLRVLDLALRDHLHLTREERKRLYKKAKTYLLSPAPPSDNAIAKEPISDYSAAATASRDDSLLTAVSQASRNPMVKTQLENTFSQPRIGGSTELTVTTPLGSVPPLINYKDNPLHDSKT